TVAAASGVSKTSGRSRSRAAPGAIASWCCANASGSVSPKKRWASTGGAGPSSRVRTSTLISRSQEALAHPDVHFAAVAVVDLDRDPRDEARGVAVEQDQRIAHLGGGGSAADRRLEELVEVLLPAGLRVELRQHRGVGRTRQQRIQSDLTRHELRRA